MEEKRKAKESTENYLRTIYKLNSEDGVRSVDIAKELRITKASVSEMLRKLAKTGFINLKPYSNIFLTKKGFRKASELSEKYDIVRKFIEKLGHQNSHEEAHQLEHSFSPEVLEKLNEFLEGKRKLKSEVPSYIR